MFAGCGATLVESKAHGIKSEGVDINPISELITKAKIMGILPVTLETEFKTLQSLIVSFDSDENYIKSDNYPRLNYWFRVEEKNKIAFLYQTISGRIPENQLCQNGLSIAD